MRRRHRRAHIEADKTCLAARPGTTGGASVARDGAALAAPVPVSANLSRAECSRTTTGVTLQGTQRTSAIDQPRRALSLAADAVLAFHAVLIAFLLSGGFLAWRWPGVAVVHVLALVASAAIYLGGLDCPLTNLEKRLRTLAGEAVYEGGFIEHYLVRPVYAGGMTTALGVGLLALVVNTTLVAYGRHLL